MLIYGLYSTCTWTKPVDQDLKFKQLITFYDSLHVFKRKRNLAKSRNTKNIEKTWKFGTFQQNSIEINTVWLRPSPLSYSLQEKGGGYNQTRINSYIQLFCRKTQRKFGWYINNFYSKIINPEVKLHARNKKKKSRVEIISLCHVIKGYYPFLLCYKVTDWKQHWGYDKCIYTRYNLLI